MKKILFVALSLNIYKTLEKYFADGRLDRNQIVMIIEFFGKEVPTDLPENCFGTADILDQREIDRLADLVRPLGPYGAVLTLSELGIYAAADLRARLGVPGLSKADAEKFRNKVAMKEALKGSGLRVPKVYNESELRSGSVQLPLIAKPKAYCGSIGVRLIKTQKELTEVLEGTAAPLHENYDARFTELRENDLQFEEFIEGEICHVNGVVKNGEVIYSTSARYVNNCLDFMGGTPLGNISVSDPAEQEAWAAYAKAVVAAMKVPDGAFHIEAFLTAKGERVFLEIGARPPGALVFYTLEQVFGVDLMWGHLWAQLDLGVELFPLPQLSTDRPALHSGDLIFPMKYIPEGSAPGRFVKSVTSLNKGDLPTLKWSSLPEIGSPAENEFGYEHNLGSFMFSSHDVAAIERDIRKVIETYKVEATA